MCIQNVDRGNMSTVISFRAKPKIKDEIVNTAEANGVSIGEYLIGLHQMKESGRDLRDCEQPKLEEFANKTAEFYLKKMNTIFDIYFKKLNAQQQQFIEIYEEQISMIKQINDRSISSNEQIQNQVKFSDAERRKQIISHTKHIQKRLETVEEKLETVSVQTKAIVEVMKPKVSSPLWKRLFG